MEIPVVIDVEHWQTFGPKQTFEMIKRGDRYYISSDKQGAGMVIEQEDAASFVALVGSMLPAVKIKAR